MLEAAVNKNYSYDYSACFKDCSYLWLQKTWGLIAQI